MYLCNARKRHPHKLSECVASCKSDVSHKSLSESPSQQSAHLSGRSVSILGSIPFVNVGLLPLSEFYVRIRDR
jgi:hypothetical protein